MNEAIEAAHRRGILTTASLMVAGDAAADAVRRARAMPALGVGLHLVAVEGPSVLPDSAPGGRFGSEQVRLGVAYAFSRGARQRLAREVTAQYRAFAATGLPLDHANAHKHMHLHPTVGRLLVETGSDFGLRAMRVPDEPASLLRAAGENAGIGPRALSAWCGVLRRTARRARLLTNDWVLGVRWSGRMTAERVARAVPALPPGLGEIYFHPATGQSAAMRALMPGYDQTGELAALLDPALARLLVGRRGWLSSD